MKQPHTYRLTNRFIERAAFCVIFLLSVVPAWSEGVNSRKIGDEQPLENIAESPKMKILLPKMVYAAPGLEANIFFNNIILQAIPNAYLFDVICDKGTHQELRWTWTPTEEDSGDWPLKIEVRDTQDRLIAQAATVVHVPRLNAGERQSLKMLCIGDSLTAPAIYTGELLKLCEQPGNPQLTLLGTKGTANNRHEGYPGWTYAAFLSNKSEKREGSPFVFGDAISPDFSRYFQEKLGSQIPDYVTILLGINDVWSGTDETREHVVDAMVANAEKLVSAIHAAAPGIKVALIPPPPPNASQDAFGANYKCGETRWNFRKNQFLGDERLMQAFGNRESENIFIIPAYLNLDCVNNYPVAKSSVNARNSDLLINRPSNGVHPAESGYLQIADSIFSWVKSQF